MAILFLRIEMMAISFLCIKIDGKPVLVLLKKTAFEKHSKYT